jgi:hypothetical protein
MPPTSRQHRQHTSQHHHAHTHRAVTVCRHRAQQRLERAPTQPRANVHGLVDAALEQLVDRSAARRAARRDVR